MMTARRRRGIGSDSWRRDFFRSETKATAGSAQMSTQRNTSSGNAIERRAPINDIPRAHTTQGAASFQSTKPLRI